MTNVWTKTSVLDRDSDGRSLEMLRKWKNAVQVIFFMCGTNERMLSRMTQRLLTWPERATVKLSMMM